MKYLTFMIAALILSLGFDAVAQENFIKPPRVFIDAAGGDAQFGAEVGADENDVRSVFLNTLTQRTGTTYVYAEQITYILAGVGLLGMVLMATFGKWQWKWAFALAGGLFVLAGFQAIIYFLN